MGFSDRRVRRGMVLPQMLSASRRAAKAASDEDGCFINSQGKRAGWPFSTGWSNNVRGADEKSCPGPSPPRRPKSDDLGDAWRKLTGGKGIGRFLLTLLSLLAILATGLLLRWLLFRSTRDIHDTAVDLCETGTAGVFRPGPVTPDTWRPGDRGVRSHHLHPVRLLFPKR